MFSCARTLSLPSSCSKSIHPPSPGKSSCSRRPSRRSKLSSGLAVLGAELEEMMEQSFTKDSCDDIIIGGDFKPNFKKSQHAEPFFLEVIPCDDGGNQGEKV